MKALRIFTATAMLFVLSIASVFAEDFIPVQTTAEKALESETLHPFAVAQDLKTRFPGFGERPWEEIIENQEIEYQKSIAESCNAEESRQEQLRLEEERKRLEEQKKKEEQEKKEQEEREKKERENQIQESSSSSSNNKETTYEYEKSKGKDIENSDEYKEVQGKFKWNGSKLTKSKGVNKGPHGRETYYNLNMNGVISIMRGMGNTDPYWVRSDGCKMLGNYIMVAAKIDSSHKRGRIIKCSLGYAIVCDTGSFVSRYPNGVDIAVTW